MSVISRGWVRLLGLAIFNIVTQDGKLIFLVLRSVSDRSLQIDLLCHRG